MTTQRKRMLTFGIGSIVLGVFFGVVWSVVGIGGRGYSYPPNPIVGLAIGLLGVSVGGIAILLAIKQKTTDSPPK